MKTPGWMSVHFCPNSCSEIEDIKEGVFACLCIPMCILLYVTVCVFMCVCVGGGVYVWVYECETTRRELRLSG